MPIFGLIIVGDEILSGKRQDKHLAKVIEILAHRGLQLSYAHYVGDDPIRITDALSRAFQSGDIVFSTGGIGATPDDHTRQCAAQALGRELLLHPEAAELIRERGRDIAREKGTLYDPQRDDPHRLNMAMFPAGAQLIPNPYNKVAGFFVGSVYFVPGFPVMAWPMIEWVLDTHHQAHFNQAPQIEKSLIVQGSMEASLTPLMQHLEAQFHGIKIFSLPSVDHPRYGRHIELGVKGTPETVRQAYEVMKQGLTALGALVIQEL